MRQKWAVLAIGALTVALGCNQMLAARMSETTVLTATLSDGASAGAEAVSTGDAVAVAAAETAPRVVEHLVARGETLSGIAAQYGTDTATLKSVNNIQNERGLRVGQKVQVLTVPGVLHQIVARDTLWDLARSYGVALEKIYQANPHLQQTALKLGQRVIIPGAQASVPRQAVAARGSSGRVTSTASGTAKDSLGQSAAFSWPLRGQITSGFEQRWGKLHQALDIAVPTGTSVKAALSGTVTYAGWATSYGYLVKIKHSNGYETRYGHNSRLLVNVGQSVSRGQVIAKSGSTGFSTGPHLHFEVRKYGSAINPLRLLP